MGAGRDLAEGKARAPSHADVADLEASLERLRRTRQKPLVERVKSLVGEGHFGEAEAALRELRVAGSIDPDLRAVLAAIDDHERRKRTAHLVAGAERALASSDLETARGLLRQALIDPPEDERVRIEQRLAATEAKLLAAAETAAAAPAIKLLAAGDLTEGLLAYAGLMPGARVRVREATGLRALEHLDATGVTGGGARARAAALAVLALGRAEAAVESDPRAALDLLAAHSKVLDGLRAAETVARRAEIVRTEREAAEAHRRFEAARALLAPFEGGHPAEGLAGVRLRALREAGGLLSNMALSLLPEPERAEASALRDVVSTELLRHDLVLDAGRLAIRGDVGGARGLLEEPAMRSRRAAPGGEEEAAAIRHAIDVVIQVAFNVCVAGEGASACKANGLSRDLVTGAAVPMPDPWGVVLAGTADAERCLRNDGRDLYLLQSRACFVFLRVIDVASKPPVLRTLLALRTPEPSRIHGSGTNDEKIVGLGALGAAITLSPDDFRVLGWLPPRADLLHTSPPSGLTVASTIEEVCLSPDLRFVWCVERPRQRPRRLRIFDLDTMRRVHEETLHERTPGVSTAEGAPGVGVALRDDPHGTIDLRGPDGSPVAGGRFTLDAAPFSFVPFPGGGLFAIAREGGGAPARAVHLVPGSPPRDLLPLPDDAADDILAAACDPHGARIFILFEGRDDRRILLALAVDREIGVVTPLFRATVPTRSLLVQDGAARRPALFVADRGIFEVVPLGASPPELPLPPDPLPLIRVPWRNTLRDGCRDPKGPRPETVERFARALLAHSAQRSRLLTEVVERNDPEEMLDLCRAVRIVGETVTSARLEIGSFRKHPDHPEHRWSAACPRANVGDWTEVRKHLDGVDEARFDDATARHFAHMLGLALLHAAEHDEAQRVLARGLERAGACPLMPLLAVATTLDDAGFDPRAERPIRELLRRIAFADAGLAAGDAEAAISALDDLLVWEAREVQSSARLARALLDAGEAGSPDRQLRKLFALATFIDAHTALASERCELLLRDRWGKDTLDALSAEAKAWIDALMCHR